VGSHSVEQGVPQEFGILGAQAKPIRNDASFMAAACQRVIDALGDRCAQHTTWLDVG